MTSDKGVPEHIRAGFVIFVAKLFRDRCLIVNRRSVDLIEQRGGQLLVSCRVVRLVEVVRVEHSDTVACGLDESPAPIRFRHIIHDFIGSWHSVGSRWDFFIFCHCKGSEQYGGKLEHALAER